ncbi:Glucose-6-phosphate 1-dehydrogenase [Nitrospira sp. KM1]|uniref:glucose-6-phosphate dehydrogenase n=1 Tax=Nitrospira sp. KM1 TaxID=1936990 RepID=UPI0013A788C9|nr:glucose-6-phosphate dehydrogenase [Nitrospira sp. KM1]BCA57157.1 Glucose-6-phosphate 1-dehydrogenase [Nitrospira sp. KM1]
MIRTLVILGASGDLTARLLMPAIVRLYEEGQLPDGFRIIGAARNDWDTQKFRAHLDQKLQEFLPNAEASSKAVLSATEFHHVDVTRREDIAAALENLKEPIVAYLALPPPLFAPTIQALAALPLPAGSKVILEKPFGESLASAQKLNRLLHDSFPEEAVFRLDHFLGKQTVQSLLGLRFANRVFEPIWNTQHVSRVEIIWDEVLTASGRASFYDGAGALRDMIQNHLLQLLALVAMEPLHMLDARTLRDRKVDVLRAVRKLSPEEVKRRTTRGRYTGGMINGEKVPGYVEEPGVDAKRQTETFAQVELLIDNWRWSGVPFVLRTGKGLGRDRREIAIYFRAVPHLAFGQAAQPEPNVLRIELSPDRIVLRVNINECGDLFDLEQIDLDASLRSGGLTAYGRLLLDVLNGDPTLSIRDDEAEEAWRIVAPILAEWSKGSVPLAEYAAGSQGPISDHPDRTGA